MTGYDDQRLVSFLLDELASAEREEVEQRIFSDDELFARVEDIENDMVDDYVAGRIDQELRARFELSLAENPPRKEKVLFSSIFLDELATGSMGRRAAVIPFRRGRVIAFRGALAAALLAIVIGVPMLLQRSSADREAAARPAMTRETSEAARRAAIDDASQTERTATTTETAGSTETPLVALNRPRASTAAAPETGSAHTRRTVTFVISTVSLRSGSGLAALDLGDDVGTVLMQLALESDEFPSYNVDVRNSLGQSVWSATRLPVATIDGGPALSFDVPADRLTTGRHELVLAGVDESGTEEVAYVDFEVDARH